MPSTEIHLSERERQILVRSPRSNKHYLWSSGSLPSCPQQPGFYQAEGRTSSGSPHSGRQEPGSAPWYSWDTSQACLSGSLSHWKHNAYAHIIKAWPESILGFANLNPSSLLNFLIVWNGFSFDFLGVLQKSPGSKTTFTFLLTSTISIYRTILVSDNGHAIVSEVLGLYVSSVLPFKHWAIWRILNKAMGKQRIIFLCQHFWKLTHTYGHEHILIHKEDIKTSELCVNFFLS